MYVGELLYDYRTRIKRVSFSAGCLVRHCGCRLDGSFTNTIDGLFRLLLKNVWYQRNILHSYLTNTPQVARQNDSIYDWAQKLLNFWGQIWSLDPTRPDRGSTRPVSSSGPSTTFVRSFVHFIRGGGWLLAVFRRAFSYRQRWGLDMAQCAIPL